MRGRDHAAWVAAALCSACFYKDNPAFIDDPWADPIDPADLVSGVGDCDRPTGEDTVLSAAAEGLDSGAWCELALGNFDWEFINAPGTNFVFISWASQMTYDVLDQKIRYVGGPEAGMSACLEYDERGDEWSYCELPAEYPEASGFDFNAMDPATGDHYLRGFMQDAYYRWDGTMWRVVPSAAMCNASPYAALAWDTAREGLVVIGQEEVCFFDVATRQWSRDAEVATEDTLNYQADYDTRLGAAWLHDGTDTTNHWIDRSGQVTALAPSPIPVGCCGGAGVTSAYDYPTGRFVVASPQQRRWFDFDLENDEWREFESNLPLSSNQGTISVPLPNYGVIVYLVHDGGGQDPRAFMYRHG